MARPKAKAPARRYHMSGQSVVTISGSDFYLGPRDSPEAIARYAALVTLYQQRDLQAKNKAKIEDQAHYEH